MAGTVWYCGCLLRIGIVAGMVRLVGPVQRECRFDRALVGRERHGPCLGGGPLWRPRQRRLAGGTCDPTGDRTGWLRAGSSDWWVSPEWGRRGGGHSGHGPPHPMCLVLYCQAFGASSPCRRRNGESADLDFCFSCGHGIHRLADVRVQNFLKLLLLLATKDAVRRLVLLPAGGAAVHRQPAPVAGSGARGREAHATLAHRGRAGILPARHARGHGRTPVRDGIWGAGGCGGAASRGRLQAAGYLNAVESRNRTTSCDHKKESEGPLSSSVHSLGGWL